MGRKRHLRHKQHSHKWRSPMGEALDRVLDSSMDSSLDSQEPSWLDPPSTASRGKSQTGTTMTPSEVPSRAVLSEDDGINVLKRGNPRKPGKQRTYIDKAGGLYRDFDEVNAAILGSDTLPDIEDDMIDLPMVVQEGGKAIAQPGTSQGSTGGTMAGSGTSAYGGNVWQGYQGGTVYKACEHPGHKVLFENEGKQLFAANSHTINEFSGAWNLIIDLAGVVRVKWDPFVDKDAPKKYQELLQHVIGHASVKSEVLRLHWNDMQAPPCKPEFWKRLWELLPEKTCIVCYGGHGRTGSCLAALMITAGYDYYTAVETVRADHCSKAIETLPQELYLHTLYTMLLTEKLEAAVKADDQKEAKDISEDLLYTNTHKPTQTSSYGLPPAPKEAKPPKESTKQLTSGKGNQPAELPFSPNADDLSTGYKVIGGRTYVRECTRTTCRTMKCNDPLHMSWVEIDWQTDAVWNS